MTFPLSQDDDPYVRKTAAVCVAKLHDINAELVEDRGFLDSLRVGVLPSVTPSRSRIGLCVCAWKLSVYISQVG